MWHRLRNELQSPFNLITGIIGVLGFLWGLYAWYETKQTAVIAYKVDQVQLLASDKVGINTESGNSGKSSPFQVVDTDGNLISSNIYGAVVTIWNAGDVELNHDRVRRPISIQLGDGLKILDFGISFVTDKNVSEFALDQEDTNTIKVKWKYFDPLSGLKARIVYASNNQSDIKVDGIVYGVKNISKSRAGQPASLPTGMASGVLLLFCGIAAFNISISLSKRIGEKLSLHGLVEFAIFILIVVIIVAISVIILQYFINILSDKLDGPTFSPPF